MIYSVLSFILILPELDGVLFLSVVAVAIFLCHVFSDYRKVPCITDSASHILNVFVCVCLNAYLA